ncbi:NAD(P)-dependent oxidoreductase [Pararoseomonas indoligenes]|uniref:NAD(P)-dependent oxidoreductase n=1 Tax=Roseomonas indoligenes TaxID=2820811 RepID=A0A940S4I8_9PROT|nr:NAD(P)-dependent oxidoreductase [Pararoseomonas indoligenes]MBP0492025.1 NAD(P)-dependent oxidoreductase [Pararoseomonas indoligenes]
MNIALIGATGNAGSRILAELARRGHAVTAIARKAPGALPPGATFRAGDANDRDALAALLRGHDAVVSSVHFLASDAETLIGAVKAAGVPRYLVVGGAGSLEVAPGLRLVDTPDFPAAYKAEATAGAAFLDRLRREEALDWTFLSPSAFFVPGERTGRFRLGGDSLLVDVAGESRISFEDFAIALSDELETPAHSRRRFTVGY